MTMAEPKRGRRPGRPARVACRLAALGLVAVLAACRESPQQRERVLAEAARVDQAIASEPVVRDLRTPSDTGWVIYTPPPSLALPTATATGTPPVTAPFGIAVPDTLRARRATTPDSAGAAPGSAPAGPPKPASGGARRPAKKPPPR